MPDTIKKLRGIRIWNEGGGANVLNPVDGSIAGVIGTAPDANVEAFPLDANVLIISNMAQALLLGRAGTLLTQIELLFAQGEGNGATIVVRRVEKDADDAVTISNFVGSLAAKTGFYGFVDAENDVGVKPSLFFAPSYGTATEDAVTKNPITVAGQAVADKMHGYLFAEADTSTKEAAVAWRELHGHKRTHIIAQSVKVWSVDLAINVTVSALGLVVGLVLKKDADEGLGKSPENMPVSGITGLNRAVDFNLHDPNSEAQYLADHQINCIVHVGGRWVLWGALLATEVVNEQFLKVERVNDFIAGTIQQGFLWAVGKDNSSALADLILEDVNQMLRELHEAKVILGGKAWWPPELNPLTALIAGKMSIDFDKSIASPMQDLRFRMYENSNYLLADFGRLAAKAAA